MAISFKEAGEKLAQTSGWKPEPRDNSSAKSVGFVVFIGAGVLTLCLSGQPAFPGNLLGALLVGGVAGGLTYGVMAK